MEPGEWPALLARAGLPIAVALVGGVVGVAGVGKNRGFSLSPVYFAAGAFLALAVLHLLPEAARGWAWPAVAAAAALGWGVCALLARWAGSFCPACEAGHAHHHHDHHHPHHDRDHHHPLHDALPMGTRLSYPLLAVIAIHSGLDGFPLADAGARAADVDLVSLAVVIHKFPEGLAVAAVLRAAGRSAAAALGWTAAVEACTLLGLLAGMALGVRGGGLLGLSMAAVAGSFLYLAVLTLATMRESRRPALDLGLAVAGAGAVLVARLALG